MKRILVAVIALGAMFSNAAFASEQLAKEKNCLASTQYNFQSNQK